MCHLIKCMPWYLRCYSGIDSVHPIYEIVPALTGLSVLPDALEITTTRIDSRVIRVMASDDNELPISATDSTGHTQRVAISSDLTTGTDEGWRVLRFAIAAPTAELVTISKTSNAGILVQPGDTLTYTIDVQTASNVTVSDILPTGVVYAAGTTLVSFNGGAAVSGNPPPQLVAAGDGYTGT
ncbi:MAG: putative repeat protein (TIGR01451 family) [Verrucomicrobiales bacterium]|jgi:uncharacterized repeat protein (TIGR01451 family)